MVDFLLANDIAFHFSLKIEQIIIFTFLLSQMYTYFGCDKENTIKNFQNRVTWFYAPVAGNERLPEYVSANSRMCCGRQSRARTKDPIRRYEHADPALWTYANQWQVVYEQALEKRTSGGTSRHQRHVQRSCSPSSWKHLSCSLGETNRWWHGENGFSIVLANEHVALRTWPYKN